MKKIIDFIPYLNIEYLEETLYKAQSLQLAYLYKVSQSRWIYVKPKLI